MTARPGRARAAELVCCSTEPLPDRPTLTTPPRLRAAPPVEARRGRFSAQPWAGLGGTVLTVAAFAVLAFGTGDTRTSLLVLGPLALFALPAVAMVAFWWNDWPGSRLPTPWTGVIDTVLVAAFAVVLTIAGQAVVERSDLRGVFQADPGGGAPATFPATLPLAAAVFTATLQLTLVSERWPLNRLSRLPSGLAALALSWAIGAAAYFLLVNHEAVPAAERSAAGLRDPGGPVPAPDFGAALVAVGVWQTVVFIGLRGWPVHAIARRAPRLLAGNVLVIALGAVTYVLLREAAGWRPAAIGAACGCVITGVLITAMLFDGWPASRLPTVPGRVLTLVLSALVAFAIDRALYAYAGTVAWTRATADDWVTTAALSFLSVGVILHVGIGRRWPFTPAGDPEE
ncbi:hypothetical protein SAMN05443665_10459 [Actinomadura meyerae]|uniref:Uncharacterized protein n=1 Tax=Actinomadura meyerae TaxID=240840 RepID=A0A239NPN9_9ACTN|nr:hypothetical protein [Actinomadura meyerae]SNT56334.1 hypothetical protein SAMN05443665_10459 [Actinomadura meyerae]